MELSLSREDAAFRDGVRAFIAENYPHEMRVPNPETDLTKQQMLLWHRILHKKGWIAPLWPKEYGGPGWSITERFIFEQETSRAGTLPPLAFGVTMVGPVIYTFGDEAQKKKFLPRILSGKDWWCQGYSEPGSGSDLASIRTKAVRDGTITSSTVTRLGPRWRNMPTGSFAWCAPIPLRKRRPAFRSC
jgi:alkylation response protein AidB-like acyl-CoA dehydrogenase